ncbi:hypothetical protein HWD35_16245 [Tsukamurella tyrosinosolvens]|uniref:hypothetical protein n=1 Tax=Tsukamurella tyrosinosolvens TaxID=57704 RepID=UPI001CE0A1B5|nr:hypothetical protein [Tsukamurella tyrosinosolvens]MCA4996270.1 hypothetical protein [Tsukamurella tyrosinosolvens]
MSVLHEATADCSVEYLSEAETEAMLESIAQSKMGISIAEFRQRRDRGEYAGIDWDTIPGLVDVAILDGADQ